MMAAFYVAARDTRAWRTLVATALASFALLAALAVGLATSIGGWDAGHWHVGVGAFSTYLVLIAPLLLTLRGARPRRASAAVARAMLLALVLLALVIAAARSFRQPDGVGRARRGVRNRVRRWPPCAGARRCGRGRCAGSRRSIVAAGGPRRCCSRQTALDKAKAHFPPQTTRGADLRRAIRGCSCGSRTLELISVRPWRGYGFGKSILAAGAARRPATIRC